MKKARYVLLVLILSVCTLIPSQNTASFQTKAEIANKPKLAIVIDDFGYDRKGVDDMLNLPCKLTIAVMPSLPFSVQDAETAHLKGHEIILHMPMEAYGNLPDSWYGPSVIRCSNSLMEVRNILCQAIQSIPYVNGVNIHMGTAVSQNEDIMQEILSVTKERNLLFLDSRTIEGSVCEDVAMKINAPFIKRDVFLEVGGASYSTAIKRINEAVMIAKNNGKAVAIGHIGAVGRELTAKAIKDSLDYISSQGVEIVALSELK